MNILKNQFYKFSKEFGSFVKRNLYSNNILKTKLSRSLFHFSSFMIFEKKYKYQKKIKKIDIILWPIWGNEFYNFFLEFCLPSLMQEGNLLWLSDKYNVEFDIYYRKNIDSLKSDKNINYLINKTKCKINFLDCDETFNKSKTSPMINIFQDHIKKSLNNNSLSIQILADLVYSKDSFKNLLSTIHGKNYCYTFTHARVNKNTIMKPLLKHKKVKKTYDQININSNKLVSLASKHLTDTMKYQNDKLENNLTHTGISYRKINKKFIVVANLLHPYVCNFQTEDLNYFKKMKLFTETDRAFPSYLFMKSRLKVITSSNILFAVELSDNIKVKKNQLVKQLYNDQKMNQHNIAAYIFNSIINVWEEE